LWAFDLLSLNWKDLLDLSLVTRRAKLQALIERHDHPTVSGAFDDPLHSPHASSAVWLAKANKERWRLLEKAR